MDDIRSTAREFAAKDHSQFNAFVFFILSHGDSNDVIYGVNGGTISVTELMCLLKPTECPTLQNKPRLFSFQACKRCRENHGMTASGTVPSSSGTQMVSVSALSRTTYISRGGWLPVAFFNCTRLCSHEASTHGFIICSSKLPRIDHNLGLVPVMCIHFLVNSTYQLELNKDSN